MQPTVEKSKTAILVMDYQNDVLAGLPEGLRNSLVSRTAQVVAAGRKAGLPVIYVVLRFREGYPEANPRIKMLSMLKQSGRFREGAPGSAIHADLAPQPGDPVVAKRRVGAFSTTDLDVILRAKGITALVLAGIATSGVVLSTVRDAADRDYEMVVLSDCCADGDQEVNRVLMEKVLSRQSTVATSEEFLGALGS